MIPSNIFSAHFFFLFFGSKIYSKTFNNIWSIKFHCCRVLNTSIIFKARVTYRFGIVLCLIICEFCILGTFHKCHICQYSPVNKVISVQINMTSSRVSCPLWNICFKNIDESIVYNKLFSMFFINHLHFIKRKAKLIIQFRACVFKRYLDVFIWQL